MVKDISVRRGAIERLAHTSKPRLADGPLVAQMAAIIIAEIDGMVLFPSSTAIGAGLRSQRAELLDDLETAVGSLLPCLPLLAGIVERGSAETNEEMQVAGHAAVFARSFLALFSASDNADALRRIIEETVQNAGKGGAQ
jgi:hypothetical protein